MESIVNLCPLKNMMAKQEEYMNILLLKGKINRFPSDLATCQGQRDIRDTISFLIEELSEAYEDATQTYISLEQEYSGVGAKVHQEHFHEEMADAWHLMIELLIQCDIQYGYIGPYYSYMGLINEGEMLDDKYNLFEMMIEVAHQQNLLDPLIEIDKRDCFRVKAPGINFPALTMMSKQVLISLATHKWIITNGLMKAQAILKIKPWRESLVRVDYKQFQERVMEVFLIFVQLNDFLGLKANDIERIYSTKNNINLERQKNGY